MPIGKVKGRVAGDPAGIKKRMKSSGGGKYFDRLAADSEMTVRFLTEPNEWFEFYEHYLDEFKFFPCNSGDCPGCDESNSPSFREVAWVYDVNEKKTKILCMPKTMVESVMKKYNRWKTLLDRDYILSREGSGMNDTSYEVESTPPVNRSKIFAKYGKDKPDLEALTTAQIPGATDDEDDEDDDFLREDKKKSKKAVKKKSGGIKHRRPADDDDDDDPPFRGATKKKAMKKTAPAGRKLKRR